MNGYKTLWLPGTDHAGIAAQNVVEKDLKKQGITKHELGKEKFLEKMWEWRDPLWPYYLWTTGKTWLFT